MSERISLVATFANHNQAETIIKKLKIAGLGRGKLSIISKDKRLVAGELAGISLIEEIDALPAEQFSCIPLENLPGYKNELGANRVLLVMHGFPEEITQAKSIVDSAHPESWDGHAGCSIYYGCLD
ncbi:MAG: hypothetical protein PHG47_04660 [Sulfuricella sp.]|nr:hypothetical protein [Sulfuricella sp.]